jgi:hypothetical protein
MEILKEYLCKDVIQYILKPYIEGEPKKKDVIDELKETTWIGINRDRIFREGYWYNEIRYIPGVDSRETFIGYRLNYSEFFPFVKDLFTPEKMKFNPKRYMGIQRKVFEYAGVVYVIHPNIY